MTKKSLRTRVLSVALTLFLLALATSPLAAGREALAPEVDGARLWTFMVWLDADNDLEFWGIEDINEMEVAGSTEEVAIVVQMDRIDGPAWWDDESNGNWTTTKRFYILQDTVSTTDRIIRSQEIADLGEVNMGDPDNLIEFVNWAKAEYPAERYALILWNHGNGWKAPQGGGGWVAGVVWDDTDGDYLETPELSYALSQIPGGVDLVGFDACLMAMIEVDYEIMPFVAFRVGSEHTEPAPGWPYDTILTDLIANPGWSGGELSAAIVTRYHEDVGWTQSAADLGPAYSALNSAVNGLATAMMEHIAAQAVPIAHARYGSQSFYYGENIDLYHFAERLTQNVAEPEIVGAANQVMASVSEAVVAEEHGSSWPGAHGIAIYYPMGWYDPRYSGDYLAFTADGLWDDFLQAFYQNYEPTCHDPNEPNDEMASATPIQYGESVRQAEICPLGDEDYYFFSGQGGEIIRATVTAQAIGSSLDSDLFLYDASGVEVAYNNDFEGLDSRITYVLPGDGTYYLTVRSHTGQGGPEHFYTLGLIEISANMLDSGSFEEEGRIPAPWESKRLTPKDKRVCNKAYDGSCSFKMVGTKAKKSLKQVVNISGSAGDSFTLSGWSKAKKSSPTGGPYCLEAKVKYTDGTKEKFKTCFNKSTHGWEYGEKTFTVAKEYNKIVVYLTYKKQSGKAWWDDIELVGE